jgi:hypothetical protein
MTLLEILPLIINADFEVFNLLSQELRGPSGPNDPMLKCKIAGISAFDDLVRIYLDTTEKFDAV